MDRHGVILVLDTKAPAWHQAVRRIKEAFGEPNAEIKLQEDYTLCYVNPPLETVWDMLKYSWNDPHVIRVSLEQPVDRTRDPGDGDANRTE